MTQSPILRKIRLGAGIALLCAICMPLSQCANVKAGSSAPPSLESFQFFPRDDANYDYQYAIKNIDFSWQGALTVLAFTWPIPCLLLGAKFSESRHSWILNLIEPFLSAGTIYLTWALTFGGDLLYGAYVGFIAAGVIGFTSLYLLFRYVAGIFRKRGFWLAARRAI
jgi:hypothetical protein